MLRLLVAAAVWVAALMFAPTIERAEACPMCRQANQTDSARPRAYMYSILFMLAVPATVATGFGVGFYRLSKKQRSAEQQDEAPSIPS